MKSEAGDLSWVEAVRGTSCRTLRELTAGRAKKETPIKEKVAAIRRPSQVLGVLSP